ncbi:MAG: hypothetical protein V5A66_06445 [Candidatus Thermoplasmatota archaeon]
MGENSKERIPVSELDEILRVVKEKKTDVQVKEEHDSIKIEKGSKKFEVGKDGTVQGCMPLHSLHTHHADSLEIGEEKIEVHCENGNYVFKI